MKDSTSIRSIKGKFKTLKTILFRWGWGVLFLGELLLGEFFVNYNKNELYFVFGFFFLIMGILFVPLPFILFPSKGNVPEGGRFFHTTVIVDSGIYGLVRHPHNLGWAFLIFSFVLIRQHYVITALGIIALILLYLMTKEEERDLCDKFGLEYKQYMKKVPRWNLPLGIFQYFLRKTRDSTSNP